MGYKNLIIPISSKNIFSVCVKWYDKIESSYTYSLIIINLSWWIVSQLSHISSIQLKRMWEEIFDFLKNCCYPSHNFVRGNISYCLLFLIWKPTYSTIKKPAGPLGEKRRDCRNNMIIKYESTNNWRITSGSMLDNKYRSCVICSPKSLCLTLIDESWTVPEQMFDRLPHLDRSYRNQYRRYSMALTLQWHAGTVLEYS